MAVPDTNDFSLKDVTQEIYGDTNSGRSLRQSFDDSNPDGFDENYVPSGFDPHATDKSGYKLSYFRNYDDNPVYIEVDPNSYTTDYTSDTFTLDIDCPAGEPWSVSFTEIWLSSTTTAGTGPDSINIDIATNKETEPRSADVEVSLDNYSKSDTCTVSQSGSPV